MNHIALSLPEAPWVLSVGGLAVVVLLVCLPRLLGIVYIPHTQIGVIEKIWSGKGSLKEGQIIARNGEAGFQARFLRGGVHFGLYPWRTTRRRRRRENGLCLRARRRSIGADANAWPQGRV